VVCSAVDELVFVTFIGLGERSLGMDIPTPLIFECRSGLVGFFRRPNKGQLSMVKYDSPFATDGFMWVL
jgi:hypothetical protein